MNSLSQLFIFQIKIKNELEDVIQVLKEYNCLVFIEDVVVLTNIFYLFVLKLFLLLWIIY